MQNALLKAEEKALQEGASQEAAIEAANAAAAEAIEEEEEEEIQSPDEKSEAGDNAADYRLSNARTAPDEEMRQAQRLESIKSRTSQLTRETTRPYTQERLEVEKQIEVAKTKSIALMPTKTADGTILVDWYTTDDPANPQNWTAGRKWLVLAQLAAYSMAVYGASSMYVPGEQGVMERFGVGPTPAALGLAIYVVGYGIGPLLWAPLSEIPAIGRNWVYAPTFFLFVILSIPTAVVDNYAGLLVLRFLTGFFGSPCLANGGASIGDLVSCYLFKD
jgi:DHA1 family multidrug resistance protein-like MFS transporter